MSIMWKEADIFCNIINVSANMNPNQFSCFKRGAYEDWKERDAFLFLKTCSERLREKQHKQMNSIIIIIICYIVFYLSVEVLYNVEQRTAVSWCYRVNIFGTSVQPAKHVSKCQFWMWSWASMKMKDEVLVLIWWLVG